MRGRKPASIVSASSTVISVPRAPTGLNKDGVREWKRLASIMVERATLTDADLPGLEALCSALAVMAECKRAIARDGAFVLDRHGVPKRHPALGVMDASSKTARLYMAEYGLTPVSRSRPAIRDDDKTGGLDFLG